jgi:hypothetical protein
MKTSAQQMADIIANTPKHERDALNLINNPPMQATNESALDPNNFYNRLIAQEFNH